MKLALQGFGLAALGGGVLYLGYALGNPSGAAMILGAVLMYAGTVVAFGELRRMYYRRQRERRGS